MVRLKDIAAQAGVSVMTVSKALRGASDIAPQTKTRLKLLAQQLGYVPDSMAQSLRSRNTKLFGLVLPSLADPIFIPAISALQEGAHELGCDLILAQSLNVPEREEACIRRLLSRRVDGLFIAPAYRLAPAAPIYDELLQRQVPVVILGQRAPFCYQFFNVESDDLSASSRMTRHLLDLGHKRIAFLCGPQASPCALQRLDGYRRALRENQIQPDDRLIFAAGSTLEDGEKAALQALNESFAATAIQAVNDLVAMGAANVFLSQGIRIPADLSVAGFGNVFLCEHFRVPLTTMRQPKLRLGVAALEIMQKLRRGERPESTSLSAELIIRSSTAPPKPPPPSQSPSPS
jgi:DNA-binding LacI/PurR family transcriptional regulator